MAVFCRRIVWLNFESCRELAALQQISPWCLLQRKCSSKSAVKTLESTSVATAAPNDSGIQKKLMQFFDDDKNWQADEVKVGRSWTKDDLRIKSNQDLHKLWYVLLKERNMLLTMEHACKTEVELFPSAERRDKIEISMENLEAVVRERNRAYFELETGESGERPEKYVHNQLGMKYLYKMCEHVIPKHMNRSWREKYKFGYDSNECSGFLRLYREKQEASKQGFILRQTKRVQNLLRTFPDINMEALRAKYPEVDVDKAKEDRLARGNHSNNS